MLTTSKVTHTNIPPRELVNYNKETQTPHETIDKEGKCAVLSCIHLEAIEDQQEFYQFLLHI